MSGFELRLAALEEFEALRHMLDVANEYAAARSPEPQWMLMDRVYAQLRKGIEANQCYVMTGEDNVPVASVTITEADLYTWGDMGNDGRALYFHKLMKDPSLAPPKVTPRLLKFVAQQAIASGKEFVRADTKTNQENLIAYYKKFGMVEQGERPYVKSSYRAVLLQIPARQLLTNCEAAFST